PKPLYARLPFDYRLVPSRLRGAALAFLARQTGPERTDTFPRWPDEPRVDDLRASVWAEAASAVGVKLATPTYGGGHRAAVLLTHDVDSREEIDGIARLRNLEERFGLVSSVGFVPRVTWPDRELIDSLVADGCEIYCHDIRHDARLPYQSAERIRADFERFFEAVPHARAVVQGFRAGQLLMSEQLLRVLGERFTYDLSIPDTEHGGPFGAHAGCATVYPYLVGGIL